MDDKNDNKIPAPQIVYGKIIYWISIIGAIVCLVGATFAIAFPDNNYINPHYLFSSIWEGNNPDTVWEQTGGGFPGGHFWVDNLTKWDGITQLGIVIGCSCACIALLGTGITFLTRKSRSYGWAAVSFFIATLVCLSALGIYHV